MILFRQVLKLVLKLLLESISVSLVNIHWVLICNYSKSHSSIAVFLQIIQVTVILSSKITYFVYPENDIPLQKTCFNPIHSRKPNHSQTYP